ncbi:hypothetical protein K439DRAFT_1336191 [Ramaria rubella]|nr:hypothetical protein K439DRAFT_1336191 [Ramaria rubella]
MSKPTSKFAPYRAALEAVSKRTKTPLPSLVASFAILHELTAILPLVSVFFCARALGVGERAVTFVRHEVSDGSEPRWIREKGAQWIDEGEQWAARVGKRYGLFGFPKIPKGSEPRQNSAHDSIVLPHLANDVANAVLAYGVTKILLPARIGLSMFLAPAFSRQIVEPIRSRIASSFRRRP